MGRVGGGGGAARGWGGGLNRFYMYTTIALGSVVGRKHTCYSVREKTMLAHYFPDTPTHHITGQNSRTCN